MHWKYLPALLSVIFLLSFGLCAAQADESTIRNKSRSFVEAFNRKDPRGLASLWSEDAQYVNPKTGEVLMGKREIEEEYRALFAQRGTANLKVNISEITFPSTNQAIEAGTAVINRPGEEERRTAYKAFYRKNNGDWLLTEVREVEFDFPPSNYEKLKELEWLVGRWVDVDEDSKIETVCEWDKYKNFLTQHFTVTVEDQVELEGRQVIAWDAANEKIRSWVFDSDGGFGEGTWRKEGNQWIVETAFTQSDGRQGSAINIYTPVNKDSYTWESTGREVGGEILPNIEQVKVRRI